MKECNKKLFFLPALLAGLCLIPTPRLAAQTFTTLHNFTALPSGTNGDGAGPLAGLILSGNTLYGTASLGGSSSWGAVFAINTDGTGFTNLHSFAYNEGIRPQAGLILSCGILYGAAVQGGSPGNGTLFAVRTDGMGFTNLHTFTAGDGSYPAITNSDGASPVGGLILSGNTLYGTAFTGGTSGSGAIFRVNTDGMDFTNLHSFTLGTGSNYDIVNSDGALPYGGLILSGTTLYGTAETGGAGGAGTVFAINIDGTGFTNLHSFLGYPSEGDEPQGDLILHGNTLYGTTFYSGSGGAGTVFAVNINGTGYTNVHNFTGGNDGSDPVAGLILSGNTLYGTTLVGGSANKGTVFAVNTDGTDFKNVHDFTGSVAATSATSDGAETEASLILAGGTLYGTTVYGGSSGFGTVFSLSFAPQLTIVPYEPMLF